MIITVLKDRYDNNIIGLIISEYSTSEQIQTAIDNVRMIEGYTWDDLLEGLPGDCIFQSANHVYY